jgi:hypothetical protein
MVRPLQFLTFLVFTAVVLLALFGGPEFKYLSYIFVFLLVPLIDLIVGENKTNADSTNEIKWRQQ